MALLGAFVNASPAHAQPPASNPNEMCGNGETFTVDLPGSTLGIDDKNGLLASIEAPDIARDDQITLPKGCQIYAFLISGWGDNDGYDRIIFYKFAEFVAQRNGYVHVGWWNNLGKEYMERPLHQEVITVSGISCCTGDIHATPGTNLGAFPEVDLDLPKANPDEDTQFVIDLRATLRAVRQQNPGALIILVGHSMGGNAIVHAVAGTDIQVDLLAPIDPVGNRDKPSMLPSSEKYNWTRWRATHDFRGWKIRDCERQNEPAGTGSCRNYGFFLFPSSYRCVTRGDWLDVKPLPLQGSLAPALCPGPVEDTGPTITIGRNIGRLYHRWQTEALFPLRDWHTNPVFNRPMPRSETDITSRNFQRWLFTCSTGGYDPDDDNYQCFEGDGHGELVGVRVKSDLNDDEQEVPDENDRVRPGLQLTNWPPRSSTFTPGQRRERLIQLSVDGADWPYRPKNPDLCLVCDDLRSITEHMLSALPGGGTDTVPPTSSATATPEANAQGWVNEDVVVSVGANDNRSVQEIQVTLSGAQTGTTTTPGNSADASITAEGLTSVSYFARDASGNVETPHTLEIRIDKTTPEVSAVVDILPNAHGWIGSPVVVSFVASDEAGGSGIAAVSPDVSVNTEGPNQEITGSAEDNAGNTGAAQAILSIDLTPPVITFDSRAPSANAEGWNKSAVTVNWNCTDALSDVLASTDAVHLAAEGRGQSAIGTCRDKADHVTTDTLPGINIDMTPPAIALDSRAPAANGAGWNNTAVDLTWSCDDALSGALESTLSASITGEGFGQSRTAQCTDAAENSASHTQGDVNIDLTPPAIAPVSPVPAANSAGWNNTAVTLAWDCTDALSGPVDTTVSASIASEGAGQSRTGQCVDAAQNTANHTQGGVNIDLTDPAVILAAPANGASYLLNAAVAADFGCTDALSGIGSCAGTLADGALLETSSPGGKTFTVTATDLAVNASAVTHAYSVRYNFTGFASPIRPEVNRVNAGRTVPVKFSLLDANSAFITTLAAFASLGSDPVACDSGEVIDLDGDADGSGETTIRYDAAANQFIYNWKTESSWAGTCRVLTLALADGSEHVARFRFQ